MANLALNLEVSPETLCAFMYLFNQLLLFISSHGPYQDVKFLR